MRNASHRYPTGSHDLISGGAGGIPVGGRKAVVQDEDNIRYKYPGFPRHPFKNIITVKTITVNFRTSVLPSSNPQHVSFHPDCWCHRQHWSSSHSNLAKTTKIEQNPCKSPDHRPHPLAEQPCGARTCEGAGYRSNREKLD